MEWLVATMPTNSPNLTLPQYLTGYSSIYQTTDNDNVLQPLDSDLEIATNLQAFYRFSDGDKFRMQTDLSHLSEIRIYATDYYGYTTAGVNGNNVKNLICALQLGSSGNNYLQFTDSSGNTTSGNIGVNQQFFDISYNPTSQSSLTFVDGVNRSISLPYPYLLITITTKNDVSGLPLSLPPITVTRL